MSSGAGDGCRVRRVVICSGKVYYDLVKQRDDKKIDDIAIIRVEVDYLHSHSFQEGHAPHISFLLRSYRRSPTEP